MIRISATGKSAQELIREILQETHHIGQYTEWNKAGRWSECPDFCYWDKPTHELKGKTMGATEPLDPQFIQLAEDFGLKVKTFGDKEEDCDIIIEGGRP